MEFQRAVLTNGYKYVFSQSALFTLIWILMLVMNCVPAIAFEDPLQSKAIMSPLASKALLLDVAIADGLVVAVGDRGHIVYSEDAGDSWRQAQVPVRVTLTAVTFPESGADGWTVGHQGVILVSHDAGKTWTKQLDGRQAHQLMADVFAKAVEEKTKELEGAKEEERENLKTEREELETRLEDSQAYVEEGPNRPFLDVWFRNASEGFAVGAFGLIVSTSDGGKTWTCPAAAIENPEAYHFNSINMTGGVLYIAGEAGHAWRSLDMGATWEIVETPYIGSFFAIGGDDDSVMFGGMIGNVFLSHDHGDSWVKVASNTRINISSVLTLKDGRLLASQYSSKLLISNEDQTQLTPLNLSLRGAISSIALNKDGYLFAAGTNGVQRINALNYFSKD